MQSTLTRTTYINSSLLQHHPLAAYNRCTQALSISQTHFTLNWYILEIYMIWKSMNQIENQSEIDLYRDILKEREQWKSCDVFERNRPGWELKWKIKQKLIQTCFEKYDILRRRRKNMSFSQWIALCGDSMEIDQKWYDLTKLEQNGRTRIRYHKYTNKQDRHWFNVSNNMVIWDACVNMISCLQFAHYVRDCGLYGRLGGQQQQTLFHVGIRLACCDQSRVFMHADMGSSMHASNVVEFTCCREKWTNQRISWSGTAISVFQKAIVEYNVWN